ncbi:class C sortase [Lactiplantibacillus plantarum]|uniref:class C sortase n=1 Tax=Lactiplantibacillus plantarum TaxID=1590 RepID=UPI001BABBE33|nr:class C sortase [Lactiplantibacillus plantarum]MBS0955441.1 class C sortase [Lactiplantibacillus plantarum]
MPKLTPIEVAEKLTENRQQRHHNQRRQRYLQLGLKGLIVLGFGIAFALIGTLWLTDYQLARKQNIAVSQYDKSDHHESTQRYLDMLYKQQTAGRKVDPFRQATSDRDSHPKHSVDVAKATLKPIATLSIPKIKEVLPVYGNTGEYALNNGAGLVENTGDLLGGKGKHAAIAAHSGLSVSRLFTFLFRVQKGDQFFIRVNGMIHAYRVDQVKNNVDPHDFSALKVNPKQDYVTLITCSARDNNSRRILVRGHRVKYVAKQNTGENGGLTSLGKLILANAVTLVMFFIWKFIKRRRKIARFVKG